MAKVLLTPSILTRSVKTAQKQITLFRTLCPRLHLDLMDGIFVPSRSFAIRQLSKLRLPRQTSAHLMVSDPSEWMSQGVQAGIRSFILHTSSDFTPVLLRELSAQYNLRLALRPGISLSEVTKLAKYAKGLHVMTVEPGRQGNPFLPGQIALLRRLRKLYPRTSLSVDGHMNADTIPLAVQAGADEIILGSVLTRARNPKKTYRELQKIVHR